MVKEEPEIETGVGGEGGGEPVSYRVKENSNISRRMVNLTASSLFFVIFN